jgi:hypothetical protein
MLNSVGMCLAGLGALGAFLAGWQFAGWASSGAWPTAAAVWRESGLTGQLFVAFFAWLPQLLVAAILFHLFVAAVGTGLLWRRIWAWRGALVLAISWIALAAVAWFVARTALDDLASGYPARAAFARAAEVVASEVTLLSVALGAGLVLLLVHPAVREQFSADS